MNFNADKGAEMNTTITDNNQRAMQASWDSEKRNSPYSTVAHIEDETCEICGDDSNTCGCED